MIFKNLDGAVGGAGELTAEDSALLGLADTAIGKCRAAMDVTSPNEALDAIWNVLDETNKYFDEQAPWGLKKTDPARMQTVLYVTAEIVRQVAILCQAFIPESATRLLDQLKIDKGSRDFTNLGADNRLNVNTIIEKPEGVFPRYVEKAE